MAVDNRFKIIKVAAWAVSAAAFIAALVFTTDPQKSPLSSIYTNILLQAGGAFFFALTVGWVVDRVRDIEGYSVLWLFSQEFREAGVLAFYADRANYAEKALEDAFKKQGAGEILMAGASLRLFLAPGLHFYQPVEKLLGRRHTFPLTVRALSCSPEHNYELPLRSFIEEFNQDKTFPKSDVFDWNKKLDFVFEEFESSFFDTHGIYAPSEQRVRVVHDLESTRAGVKALQGAGKRVGNHLHHREFKFAPYCTVIIFPDRAFYTPNLLSSQVPVNLPMIVFHKTSDSYAKLKDYFELLWWVSENGGQSV